MKTRSGSDRSAGSDGSAGSETCADCGLALERGETCPICTGFARVRELVVRNRQTRVAMGQACLPVGDRNET